MRRWLVLGLMVLSGCPWVFEEEEDGPSYTYCDDTGCYRCWSDDDCEPIRDGTDQCRDDWDCATEFDCVDGTCRRTSLCDSSVDCSNGNVCDARSTCVEGGTCQADNDCPGGFCDEMSGQCVGAEGCIIDPDCGRGWECDSRGVCVPMPCTSSEQCMEGCYCASGMCRETLQCSRDEDCDSLGMICDEARNTCQPEDPGPGPGCQTDADCAMGEACCDGTCKPPRTPAPADRCTYDGECGLGGDCRDGFCHNACDGNEDCGTGDICVSLVCEKNPTPVPACTFNNQCPANHTCINATCHTNCTTDAECLNPADFCDDGICRPDWRRVAECGTDANCTGPGEQCVDGQCRTRCFDDAACANCPDGPTCVMGYCQEVE